MKTFRSRLWMSALIVMAALLAVAWWMLTFCEAGTQWQWFYRLFGALCGSAALTLCVVLASEALPEGGRLAPRLRNIARSRIDQLVVFAIVLMYLMIAVLIYQANWGR